MTDRDDQLADLLMRWDDAKTAGRPLTPQALCRDTPHLLGPFTELLRRLGRVDPILKGTAPPVGPGAQVIDAGRFAPLAFHDEGGLGVVYLAEDTELKRAVALKWMKPLPGLDPHARRRFLQEAEITGKLEHPGVAPVYGAGHDPHGRPYYAMRFINGTTFGDAVERLHRLPGTDTARAVEFGRLLRAFVSVCQTVAYAHARGVIHRDLKPGNVMLGPYGEALVVDWGLAKRVDLPAPHETVDTGYGPVELHLAPGGGSVSGQVKGSPAYMAPEQAMGETDRVGPPADVYALGATLYALLTGRAPYTGASAGEIIEQVERGAPPPPCQAAAGVACPLDAICTKAMSRDPADRYASPKELAEDIEKWLADEPVSAYRDPLVTRARRWVKHHRTPVATGLAVLLVVGVALAVVVPLLAAKNRELAGKNDALEKANNELAASNAARQAEFEAADTSLRAVMSSALARSAASEDALGRRLRTAALLRYRDYLNGFIARHASREDLRLELAVARFKTGEAGLLLGELDAAVAAHAEAERRFADLSAAAPTDRDVLFGWALAKLQRGSVLNQQDRITEARALLVSARDTFAALATDPAPLRITRYTSVEGVLEDSPRFRLAEATMELARVQYAVDAAKRTGIPLAAVRGDAAMRAGLRDALRALTGGKALPPTAPVLHQLKAFALRVELAASDPAPQAAVPEMERVLKELEAILKESPLIEFRHLQFAAQQFIARNPKPGDTNEAILTRLSAAEQTALTLTQADHGLDHLGLRDDAKLALAEARCAVAERVVSHDPRVAKHRFEMALKTLGELAARDHLQPDVRLRAFRLCTRLAETAALNGHTRAVAEQGYEAALKLLVPLRSAAGDAGLTSVELMLNLSWANMRVGQQLPPGAPAEAARALLAKLKAAGPDDEFLATADVTLAGLDAAELARSKRDWNAATERIQYALRRLNDAERLNVSPAFADVQRLGLGVALAAIKGGQAEAALKSRPPEVSAARELIAEAERLTRAHLAIKVRHDPALAAALEPLEATARDGGERLLRALDKLKKELAQEK